MPQQYRQENQLQINSKQLIKGDNKIYRVQNPIRSELSISVFFLFKFHISNSVKNTAVANPQTKIIFDKVRGSWWKPEYQIIVGGKTKKVVQTATEMLQNTLNGKYKKAQKNKS